MTAEKKPGIEVSQHGWGRSGSKDGGDEIKLHETAFPSHGRRVSCLNNLQEVTSLLQSAQPQ